ncbi:hypothetical protein [Planctomycetes bacterium Pan216]
MTVRRTLPCALMVAAGVLVTLNTASAQTSTDLAIESNNDTTLVYQDFIRELLLVGGQPNSGIDPLALREYISAASVGFASARRSSTSEATINGTLNPNIMQFSPPDPAALGIGSATLLQELITNVIDTLTQPTPPFVTDFVPDSTTGNGVIGNTVTGAAYSTNTGNSTGISPNKDVPVSEGGSALTFSASRF